MTYKVQMYRMHRYSRTGVDELPRIGAVMQFGRVPRLASDTMHIKWLVGDSLYASHCVQ